MQYQTLSAEPFGSGRMRREPADARGEATRGVDGQKRMAMRPRSLGPHGPIIGPKDI